MTDNLVGRLLQQDYYNKAHYIQDPLHKQAADRITALKAEITAAVLAERERIVEWLRHNSAEICDWSPPTIASAIIDEEHLK